VFTAAAAAAAAADGAGGARVGKAGNGVAKQLPFDRCRPGGAVAVAVTVWSSGRKGHARVGPGRAVLRGGDGGAVDVAAATVAAKVGALAPDDGGGPSEQKEGESGKDEGRKLHGDVHM